MLYFAAYSSSSRSRGPHHNVISVIRGLKLLHLESNLCHPRTKSLSSPNKISVIPESIGDLLFKLFLEDVSASCLLCRARIGCLKQNTLQAHPWDAPPSASMPTEGFVLGNLTLFLYTALGFCILDNVKEPQERKYRLVS